MGKTIASLAMPIRTESEAAPCLDCQSAFRWLDNYGVYRCKHCHRPPSKILVRKIETLINWQVPDRTPGWETVWEPAPIDNSPPFRDPFAGQLPPGAWLPPWNRTDFGCRHLETREVPCRGGECVRIECVNCGRPLDLRDRVRVEF